MEEEKNRLHQRTKLLADYIVKHDSRKTDENDQIHKHFFTGVVLFCFFFLRCSELTFPRYYTA